MKVFPSEYSVRGSRSLFFLVFFSAQVCQDIAFPFRNPPAFPSFPSAAWLITEGVKRKDKGKGKHDEPLVFCVGKSREKKYPTKQNKFVTRLVNTLVLE